MKRIGMTTWVACCMFIGILIGTGIAEASDPHRYVNPNGNPIKTSTDRAKRKMARRKTTKRWAVPAIGRECYLQSTFGGGVRIDMKIVGDGSYTFTTNYTGGCIGEGAGCHINVYMVLDKLTMVGGIEEWNQIAATSCIDLTMLCGFSSQTVATPPWPVQIGQSIPIASYMVTGYVNMGQCPNVGDSLGGAVQPFVR